MAKMYREGKEWICIVGGRKVFAGASLTQANQALFQALGKNK